MSTMNSNNKNRRGFLNGMLAAGAASAAMSAEAQAQGGAAATDAAFLPFYARAQNYKSLKQSSYDRTGGNADR